MCTCERVHVCVRVIVYDCSPCVCTRRNAAHLVQRPLHQAVQVLCVLLQVLLQELEQLLLGAGLHVESQHIGPLQNAAALDDLVHSVCEAQ